MARSKSYYSKQVGVEPNHNFLARDSKKNINPEWKDRVKQPPKRICIGQYDHEGYLVTTYRGIDEAKKAGCNIGYLDGDSRAANGFYWRRFSKLEEVTPTIDVSLIPTFVSGVARSVVLVDRETGNVTLTFKSLSACAVALKKSACTISSYVCKRSHHKVYDVFFESDFDLAVYKLIRELDS